MGRCPGTCVPAGRAATSLVRVISAVAFCPQAPVLVPDVAGGAAAELADLRAACRVAIRCLAGPGRELLVLGGGSGRSDVFHEPTTRGSFAGFGLDLEVPLGSDDPGPTELPPSLTVGAWLLRDALGPDCGAAGVEIDGVFLAEEQWDGRFGDDLAVLVLGDGTARRTVKAPGYLDERAAAYDETVAAALRSGDPAALTALDPVLGAELLAAGVPAWRRAGALLADPLLGARAAGSRWRAELLHESDPFGVDYVVASWTRDD
jgi:hypothetical protein